MSEMRSVHGILDVIKRITANHESGRLEINAQGTPGTLLFNEGKLVHANLGSLKGFQAVNAVVALRDIQFSFDHVAPASHVSTITPNERVVLKRFFGIEAAEMDEAPDAVEPDWNPEPEPVVPLTAVEQIDLEETPTNNLVALDRAGHLDRSSVEVAPVHSPSIVAARAVCDHGPARCCRSRLAPTSLRMEESDEATAVSFGHFRVAATRLWERSIRPQQTAVDDQL